MHSIVDKLGWELIDAFTCGLLRNKMKEYLATSLDGWIVMSYNEDGLENEILHSDSEGSEVSMDVIVIIVVWKSKHPQTKR